MQQDQQSGIENEIRETEALEASSSVTDVPHTASREVSMYDEKAAHTDTGVDVVIDVDNVVDVVVDIDTGVTNVDVDIDVDTDIDVNVDTHVDKY